MAEIVQEEFLLRGMEVVLGARATSVDVQDEGVILCSQTDFDLTRRPHWVINQLASIASAP